MVEIMGNNNTQAEDALREVAKLLSSAYGGLDEAVIAIHLENIAKSKPVEEYWQSKNKVDLAELKKQFKDSFGHDGDRIYCKVDHIFDFFKPHLTKTECKEVLFKDEVDKMRQNTFLALTQDLSKWKGIAYTEGVRADKLQEKQSKEWSEWISVEDRLPNIDVEFDVWHIDGFRLTYVGRWHDLPKRNIKKHFKQMGYTHWMPLPEPPTEFKNTKCK